MGHIFSRKQFEKIKEHKHELEVDFFPEKLAIRLPATYLIELTLKLIMKFDIIHAFLMSYGITQLKYIN